MTRISWNKLGIRDSAAALCAHLQKRGIEAALVGGACVSIYTDNAYESFDLDFVSHEPRKKIKAALEQIEFKETEGRHFDHPDCEYYAEFVPPPVSIGQETVKKLGHLKTPYGILPLLTPTDCVKDRLAAYIHWKDHQAFKQALGVAQRHKIDIKAVRTWAELESGIAAFEEFKAALKKKKPLRLPA
ncbi:MAG TPA: hypothetical protein VK914_04405 [bacterium]|jgi:hypothetical protein|nr:hypothetical protein [bacterium]